MDRRIAAEKDVVADVDMAGDDSVVGECHVVADVAIGSDMGGDHKKAACADPRYAASARSADIHRYPFADLPLWPDDELCGFAAIVHRLWRRALRGEGAH